MIQDLFIIFFCLMLIAALTTIVWFDVFNRGKNMADSQKAPIADIQTEWQSEPLTTFNIVPLHRITVGDIYHLDTNSGLTKL
jgi:hypothetical protein